MAFERLRAHGAVVGTLAVLAIGAVSVGSLVVAEGRLEQFDRNRRTAAATAAASSSTVPPAAVATPATDPAPAPAPTATTSTTTTTAVAPGPPSGLLRDLFATMNADRTANGLPPLAWDDRLSAAAQHATDAMAASGLAAPPDLDALLALGFTRAAQTVLTAPHDVTATSVEYGWMGSTPQRATILDPALRSVGIGATSSPEGHVWIAADFGAAA